MILVHLRLFCLMENAWEYDEHYANFSWASRGCFSRSISPKWNKKPQACHKFPKKGFTTQSSFFALMLSEISQTKRRTCCLYRSPLLHDMADNFWGYGTHKLQWIFLLNRKKCFHRVKNIFIKTRVGEPKMCNALKRCNFTLMMNFLIAAPFI